MRGFFAYWLTGCFLVGGVFAFHINKCPMDKEPTAVETASAVAAWPAMVFGAMFLGASGYNAPTKCETSLAKAT